jgi:exoribonuclease-2
MSKTDIDASQLARLADGAMASHGFIVHPSAQATAEAAQKTAADGAGGVKDMTALPWTSIDNPESRDLDQIEYSEAVDGGVRLYVGIADVERYVPFASALESLAGHNTTSVYTGVRTYPMLPERLSFDLSSLNADQMRFSIVIESVISNDGTLTSGKVYPALVKNKGKLAYPSVSDWLDGKAPPPGALANDAGLRAQVEMQDKLAKALAEARKRNGALDIDTGETTLVTDGKGTVTGIAAHHQTRAGSLIEELMVVSNRTVAKQLDASGKASIRRVVKEPERWARIVAYAAQRSYKLPAEPEAKALSAFVDAQRKSAPERFAELSLALVKLIGKGEYAAHQPGAEEVGHFGLATEEYAHSTAPNRRYPDLVAQRLLKGTHAYTFEQLAGVAAHCTLQEGEAKKVERQVQKSAAALLFQHRVGETFNGVITGATDKGTFVRVLEMPVEGKVTAGFKGLHVGDKVRVTLHDVSVEKGYIDFSVAQ